MKTENKIEMDKFKQSEDKGREYCVSWLHWLNATDIEFTTGKYDPVDCNFTYKNQRITAEIKVRDEKYRDYSTHFMELNKYINISNYVAENGSSGALYMNFFGENWLYVYKVNEISTSHIKNWNLVATTAENNGIRRKEIIEIPTSIAIVYNRLNRESEWKRVQ